MTIHGALRVEMVSIAKLETNKNAAKETDLLRLAIASTRAPPWHSRGIVSTFIGIFCLVG